jgi:two-component system, LytTR family, response regulator
VNATESARKIRTIIVDDEPLARSNLLVLLRPDSEIEIVGECGSGKEALEEIRTEKPDLVFLDVQMPECDGFGVLEMLGSAEIPAIIFVTAYDQYALRAFEAGAMDYLLKPFDNARFDRALGRAKEAIKRSRGGGSTPVQHFIVKNAGQITFLKMSDIDWIEAADYYSCLHVGAKSHFLRRSMADLEKELDEKIFCRIHRSTIVRLDQVSGLKLNESGEYDVILNNGAKLHLSRRYRKQLKALLGLPSN